MDYRTQTVKFNDVDYVLREAIGLDAIARSQVVHAFDVDNLDDTENMAFRYFVRIIAQNTTKDNEIPSPSDTYAVKGFWQLLFFNPDYADFANDLMLALDKLDTISDKQLAPADKIDPNA